MRVYLDNAATTPIDPQVVEAMMPYFTEKHGNPSSTHSHGREVRSAIELARKNIASRLSASPGEIFFTSGGTESINCILRNAIDHSGIRRAITSPLEHHAVLHVLEYLEERGLIELELLSVDDKGRIDAGELEQKLKDADPTLVSLMYANNEIGNLNDIDRIGEICTEHNAFFHSDTVQAMGHYSIDLSVTKTDAVVCSAHKIHGPKGVGFMYVSKDRKIPPFLLGGGQERNMRGGTENVIGIVGLAAAFDLAYSELDQQSAHIRAIKKHMVAQLKENIPEVGFNGLSDTEDSLYTVLSVRLPEFSQSDMLLFQLDLAGISASGGSACNSGAQKGSHVLEAIGAPAEQSSVRFSFSKYNTIEEVDHAVAELKRIIEGKG